MIFMILVLMALFLKPVSKHLSKTDKIVCGILAFGLWIDSCMIVTMYGQTLHEILGIENPWEISKNAMILYERLGIAFISAYLLIKLSCNKNRKKE